MKLIRLFAIAAVLIAAAAYGNMQATGIGLLFGHGGGNALFVPDDGSKSVESVLGRTTVGFLMDSRVAEKGLFNYRLHVGYQALSYYDIAHGQDDSPYHAGGLVIDNTFGFGVLQTRLVRLFVGPQIRLGFHYGSFTKDLTYAKFDASFIGGGIGFGVNIGANLNLGKLITVTAETGTRYQINYNAEYSKTTDIISNTSDSHDIGIPDTEWEGFFNVGVIFRFEDIFVPSETRKKR